MYHQNIGQRGEQRDRREVLGEIEIEIGRDRGIDGVGNSALQQRVAVLRRMGDEISGDMLPAPGRFSTTNCAPSWPERDCVSTRAATSPDAPGPKPMTIRTGRAG
jgi:hypothetical protein